MVYPDLFVFVIVLILLDELDKDVKKLILLIK